MRRRLLLEAAALTPCLSWAAPVALRLWVPASPGGGWDTTARALGQALLASEAAHEVRYVTRSGAAGTIGLAQFANETVGNPQALMVMGSVMLGGILSGRPPVDLRSVTPLARLTSEYNVIVVPPHSPHASVDDLLAAFRANPDALRWGGGSRGATEHIVLGLLAKDLGLSVSAVNYVPFRGGGEAAAALMSGAVMAASSGISEFLPHIAAGRMRALAVTAPQRVPGLEVPTLRERGHDVVMGNWRGVYGAAGLSRAQQRGLLAQLEAAVASSAWRQALQQHHWQDDWLAGEAFGQFVAQDFARMASVMSAAGLRPSAPQR